MALYYKDKEVVHIHYGNRVIESIYKGHKLIWEAIRSCFGKGWWINILPWNNENGWKNNY